MSSELKKCDIFQQKVRSMSAARGEQIKTVRHMSAERREITKSVRHMSAERRELTKTGICQPRGGS
jgi:uncharacterized coiled-coil DUF342 family protein